MKKRNVSIMLAFTAALFVLAGCVQPSTPPPPSKPVGATGPASAYVLIQGPAFQVQISPNNYDAVTISQVFIELDTTMDAGKFSTIRNNIMAKRVEIKEALQQIVLKAGYQSLFIDAKRAMIEGQLRQEIIRILGAYVKDSDIKGVTLQKYSLSN